MRYALVTLLLANVFAAADDPVIRSTSEEVSLDLIVRDKKGLPVRNLSPEEIEITDDGAKVKLNDLHLVTGEAATQATGGASPDPLRQLRLVTLLFDRMNLEAGRLARDAANEVLKTRAGPGVYFSVLLVDRRMRLLQAYTQDRDSLKSAVNSASGGAKQRGNIDADRTEAALKTLAGSGQDQSALQRGDMSGLSAVNAQVAGMMLNALQTSESMNREQTSRPSLAALMALAKQQATLPGRKAIIYFSEGMQLTTGTTQAFRNLISIANKANVTIYTVDATGLSIAARNDAARMMMSSAAQTSMNGATGGTSGSGMAMGPSSGPGSGGTSTVNIGATKDQMKEFDQIQSGLTASTQTALQEMAESTGGFFMGDSNDFRKPMRRLMEDVQCYYEAAYTPNIGEYDGHFRKIAVRMKRPRVTVQTRSGYYALPASTRAASPFEMPMLKVLNSGTLPTAFPFRWKVLHFRREAGQVVGDLVVEVPISALQIDEDHSSKVFKVQLSILALIKNPAGGVIEKLSQDIPYQGALEMLERTRGGDVIFERHFRAPAGNYTVELAVYDRNAAAMSAIKAPFDIPPAPAGVEISSIALVRRMQPLAVDPDPEEPFVYMKRKVVPTFSNTVTAAKAGVLSAFFVLLPEASNNKKPELEVEILRDGELLGSAPMPLPDGAASDGPIPYVASFPTDSLRNGAYELRAVGKQDGKSSEMAVTFQVVGGVVETVAQATVAASTPAVEEKTVAFPIAPLLNPPSRPDAEEQKRALDVATSHALGYASTLPNFRCIQLTRRFADPSGLEVWKRKDTFTEFLAYVEGSEQRATLEVNGQKARRSRDDFQGIVSTGEFGPLLSTIFDPKAKAEFEWNSWAALKNETVQVYAYRVRLDNSHYSVTSAGTHETLRTGFHGMIYIDSASGSVRRITMEADGLPPKFPIHGSAISVEYDYVRVGDHDFLMPSFAEVRVKEGRRYLLKNEITFRDYKRYAAESTIRF